MAPLATPVNSPSKKTCRGGQGSLAGPLSPLRRQNPAKDTCTRECRAPLAGGGAAMGLHSPVSASGCSSQNVCSFKSASADEPGRARRHIPEKNPFSPLCRDEVERARLAGKRAGTGCAEPSLLCTACSCPLVSPALAAVLGIPTRNTGTRLYSRKKKG